MKRWLLWVSALAMPVCCRAVLVEEPVPAAGIQVAASTTFSAMQDPRHLVDGSGLKDDLHDADGGARTMWHTAGHPTPTPPATGLSASMAWVRFDFAAPQPLSSIRIWNHNQAGFTDRGFRKTQLYTSADGTTWTSRSIELQRGDGASSTFPLALAAPVRAVMLAADSNYGSDFYGLSEVQFMTGREVAEADLPFPTNMECRAQPYYGCRADGKPGRVVSIIWPDVRLYGDVTVEAMGETTMFPHLQGVRRLTLLLPPGTGVTNACEARISMRRGARSIEQTIQVPAQRQWTVMLYPHSHVDIGYTNPQDVVEKIHMRNIDVGLELGRTTAGYPDGARHVWNNEVLWAVESWLKQATPERKKLFVDAVKKGWIGLSASYDNANTSTASDEELFRFFDYARELRKLTGDPIDTMCQFDVPGMGWGVVQAAVQSGVRAILAFPNPSDRIGDIRLLENRPFWWVAPDGKTRVLYIQFFPYNVAWKLGGFNLNPKPFVDAPGRDRVFFANSQLNGTGEFRFEPFIFGETAKLEAAGLPYDIFPCAWSLSDNAMVDAGLPDYVKKWNETYAYPKLVISSAHEIASAFETRFGKIIPEMRGDLTEYWTDGLGSDARRVGYNRVAKEDLIQAETLCAMLRPGDPFPAEEFYDAWRWIQLGSEHTWGFMSPEQPVAKKIEATKASYFEKAKATSAQLVAKAVAPAVVTGGPTLAVLNTLSWPRSGLVTVPPGIVGLAPVQKLSSGETVFLARDVPALGVRNFRNDSSNPSELRVSACSLENAMVKVVLDPHTGDIASLVDKRSGHEFAQTNGPYALNSYRYLHGGDAPSKATGPTDVKISIKENGPVLASLLVESKAEGCNKLTREISILAGMPQVEMIDTVDKIATRAKEGIHFAFAFDVPDATTRMDIPWGVMNPLTDQMLGANKNWLAFQRWIDVSNDKAGVTWVGIEPAVVQFGDITANLLGAVAPRSWRRQLGDPSTIVSWALNNHWHTNFPLEQGGEITFHYAILPHAGYDPVVANRFGVEQNRPLVAVPAKDGLLVTPPVTIDNPRVMISGLRADSGGLNVSLRSLSDRAETARIVRPGKAATTATLLPYGCVGVTLEQERSR